MTNQCHEQDGVRGRALKQKADPAIMPVPSRGAVRSKPSLAYDTRCGWLAGRKQAGAYCGNLSARTISRWMSDGSLRYRRLSSKLVLFRPEDLDRAVELQAQKAAAAG